MLAATAQAVCLQAADMNKAKNIAICGFFAALATVCMACCTLPGVKWVELLLAVCASLCVTTPLLLDSKNIVFVLIVYFVVTALTIVLGTANPVEIVPIVVFCIPSAIVKVYGESKKNVATQQHQVKLDDPFGDSANDKVVTQTETTHKPRIAKPLRIVLYYVLFEIAIAATLFVFRLVSPDAFDALVISPIFVPLLVVAQAVPPLYSLLLNVCLRSFVKILKRVIK